MSLLYQGHLKFSRCPLHGLTAFVPPDILQWDYWIFAHVTPFHVFFVACVLRGHPHARERNLPLRSVADYPSPSQTRGSRWPRRCDH